MAKDASIELLQVTYFVTRTPVVNKWQATNDH